MEEPLTGRLDEDKLDQLRHWGTGLSATGDQELAATGRAILLLIEEIEALHVELWNARTAAPEPVAAETDGAAPDGEVEEGSLDRTLGARLRRLGRRSGAGAG